MKLKAEIKTLKSTGPVTSSVSSAVSETATAPDQETARRLAEFRGLGKRFAVLSELWVRPSLLKQPCPEDLQSLGPWHSKRCANDAAWDRGIVAEMYFLLPSSYHEFIENSTLFSDGVCETFLGALFIPHLLP